MGVRLLADIRIAFNTSGRERLSSGELLQSLVQDETLPWGEFAGGRPLTPIGLARLLKPFDIQPRTIRTEQGTSKGYVKGSFDDAWMRYLPASPPPAVTPVTDRINTETSSYFQPVTPSICDGQRIALKPA